MTIELLPSERERIVAVPGLRPAWEDRDVPAPDQWRFPCGLEAGHRGAHAVEVGDVDVWAPVPSVRPAEADFQGACYILWNVGAIDGRKLEMRDWCGQEHEGLTCGLMEGHTGACYYDIS